MSFARRQLRNQLRKEVGNRYLAIAWKRGLKEAHKKIASDQRDKTKEKKNGKNK